MTHASPLADTTIVSMIAVVEAGVTVVETTVVAEIMMIGIVDTVEDVTVMMMVHASTDTVMIDTIAEVAEVVITTAMIGVVIVMVVALAMHLQQVNMAIQLHVQSLGSLMVAATPMRELTLVAKSDC